VIEFVLGMLPILFLLLLPLTVLAAVLALVVHHFVMKWVIRHSASHDV